MGIQLFEILSYYSFNVCKVCNYVPSFIANISNMSLFFFISPARSVSILLIFSKNLICFSVFNFIDIYSYCYFTPSSDCLCFILLFLFNFLREKLNNSRLFFFLIKAFHILILFYSFLSASYQF